MYDLPKRRPSVPEFQFGPPREVPAPANAPGASSAGVPVATPISGSAGGIATEPRDGVCPNCKAQNRVGSRFCITCGQVLAESAFAAAIAASSDPTAPVPAVASPASPVSPAPPASPAPISPMPMLAIGLPTAKTPDPPSPPLASAGGRSSDPALRTCTRCRAACDPSAAFCKFCGASLTDNGEASSAKAAAGNAAGPSGGSSTPTDIGRPSAGLPMRASRPSQPVQAAQAPQPAPPAQAATPTTAPMPRTVIPAPAPGLMSGAPTPGAIPAAPVASPVLPASSPVLPASSPVLPASSPRRDDVPSARLEAPPSSPRQESHPSAPAFAAGAAGRESVKSVPAVEASKRVPRGRLVIIAKDGGEGQSFPIFDGLDIGRSEGDVVLADDRYLSPRHARLLWQRDELVLRDLGSVNGVFLRLSKSQNPHMAQSLQDQDLILIGQQVIRFEIVKDAEEGLGPAMQHGTLLFGTPAAPRHARLCQRTVEGVTRDVFHIRKVETVLGRESGDIVFTEDPFLSRRHATIKLDPVRKSFTIGDLGSSNGTFLQIHGDATLKSGDEFRIGQQLFRVNLSPEGRSPQAANLDGSPERVRARAPKSVS